MAHTTDRAPLVLSARFWMKVDRSGGPDACWTWLGAPTARGYGQFMQQGYRDYVHRMSLQAAQRVWLTTEELVDHKCHTRLCVNPQHLHVADPSLNGQNRAGASAASKSGIRGVHQMPNGKWRVQFRAPNGKNVHGGCFVDLYEAAQVARELRAQVMPNSLMDLTD